MMENNLTYNSTMAATVETIVRFSLCNFSSSSPGGAAFMPTSSAKNDCYAEAINNNNLRNSKPPRADVVDSSVIRATTITFYLTTFVFGVVGNSLVIFVIAKYDKIRCRSVSNYYIWNLAFADELFVLTLPFFCFVTFSSDWIFGTWPCKVAYVFRECNKYASLFTLMALSVDRFLATYHTMGKYRQIKVGLAVCIAIWVLCLLLSVPYWLFSAAVATVNQSGDHVYSCKVNWPNNLYRQAWLYVQLFVGVLFPFAVIAIFNVLLLLRMRVRTAKPTQNGGRSSNKDGGNSSGNSSSGAATKTVAANRRDRANASMIKMVLVIVVMFAVCQLPYHINEFVALRVILFIERHRIPPSPTAQKMLIYFNMVSQILVFISSCSNPIVYGLFNKNYRKLYKQTICCCRSWDISHAATNLWPEPAKIKPSAATIPLVSGDKVCKNGDTDLQGGSVAYLLDTTVTESTNVNTLVAYPALLDSASNGDSVYTGRQEASVGCLLDTSVTTETANTPIVCSAEHTEVTEQINY